ncbi:MAG TPA: TIR domain-containing protein, partial [Planctomycetaceae bacterium]|nr:TIR domain-containing protein [Planctomycetaceae bacterium]
MATSFQYDVFLSHSSVDKAAVLELAERLKGDGLRVWLDVWVIQPGDQISVMVDRGLAASRRVVLVMSAAALDSEWVTREFHTIVFRDPINRQRRLIPLLLDDCDVPDGVSPFARIDWRTRSDAEYNRLLDICRSPIPEVEGETSQDNREPARPPIVRRRVPTPTGPSSALAPLELPPAAAKYFGRGEQVKWLAERLKAGQNSAVVGAAGMGKTALAAEAVSEAVGTAKESLPYSPFPDGVFFLDLYAMHAVADEAWNALANKVAGADFLEDKPARVRAVEACRGRRLLLIVEGAESADGAEG